MYRLLGGNRFLSVTSGAFAALTFTASFCWADSVVVVSIAGEAFDGPPRFEVLIGDTIVGAGTLKKAIATETDGRLFTKPRPSQFLEQFSFQVPDKSVLPKAEISVILANDKFSERSDGGLILDRNLFVDFVSVNGLEVTSADLALTRAGQVQHMDYQAGLLPIYEAGYRVVARPPEEGWPVSDPSASVTPASIISVAQPPIPLLSAWKKQEQERAGQ